MIRGLFFSEMIRASVRKSYNAKIRVTVRKSEVQPDGLPKSEPNRRKQSSEWRCGGSALKGP